jgi:hypothetical protein
MKIITFFAGMVLGAFLVLMCFFYFFAFVYEPRPNPQGVDFIGMTREEVAHWASINGRMRDLPPNDQDYNKIKIYEDQLSCNIFNSYNDIINDKHLMKAKTWSVGWRRLRLGTRWAYLLEFGADNKVVKQSSDSFRDW